MKRAAAGMAGVALALGGGAAQAVIVDIAWDGSARFVHKANVAPGKFVELCGKLAKDVQVQWRYEAAAPLDFNIHYHLSKSDVVYPVKLAQKASASATLAAPVDQDYCWMWSNKGERAVPLEVQLERR